MEGTVNIPVSDFERLRLIESEQNKIATNEHCLLIYHKSIYGMDYRREGAARDIVSTSDVIADLLKKNNDLIDKINKINKDALDLPKSFFDTVKEFKKCDRSFVKPVKFRGFWHRLDFLLSGKI